MSSEWPGWPLQSDVALVEHPDRTDALVDHDQVLIVFAVELTPRAEQGGLRIDGPRVTGHHVGCRGQPPGATADLCAVGLGPFPDRRDAVDYVGRHCSSLLDDSRFPRRCGAGVDQRVPLMCGHLAGSFDAAGALRPERSS
jgi:hypothetical protein